MDKSSQIYLELISILGTRQYLVGVATTQVYYLTLAQLFESTISLKNWWYLTSMKIYIQQKTEFTDFHIQ